MKLERSVKTTLIALLVAAAVTAFGYGIPRAAKPGEAQAAPAASISAATLMVPVNFSELADKVRTGVVNIQVSKKVKNAGFHNFPGNPFGDRDPFGDFFGPFGGAGSQRGNSKGWALGSL